jgi:hypothetical protein
MGDGMDDDEDDDDELVALQQQGWVRARIQRMHAYCSLLAPRHAASKSYSATPPVRLQEAAPTEMLLDPPQHGARAQVSTSALHAQVALL